MTLHVKDGDGMVEWLPEERAAMFGLRRELRERWLVRYGRPWSKGEKLAYRWLRAREWIARNVLRVVVE
jgi:hypothetical protein